MQLIGLIVHDGFEATSLAPLSVFEAANLVLGEPHYSITICSEGGGPVRGVLGFELVTEPLPATTLDTIFVSGTSSRESITPEIAKYLAGGPLVARRIAAIGLGAFALGHAGILDGLEVTTQAEFTRELQDRFPLVMVQADRLFVSDGPIWTSAGMTAGIDLALALLEQDHGAGATLAVAKHLVMHHRRAGGQSQTSPLLNLHGQTDRVQRALNFARENLQLPLTVEALAVAACLSPRQFSRVFHQETGETPARAVEKLRIDAAKTLIAQGRLSIGSIVAATGFGDRERMRRAFHRDSGQAPSALRRQTHATFAGAVS